MTEKTKCLVVLSGGQDSTTCLYIAKATFDEVHAITFDYGQRHSIEVDAARRIATMAEIASWELIKVGDILKSTSPLTSDNELEQYSSPDEMEQIIGKRVELTFVPMRNTLFLTIAYNRAVELGCSTIFTGICQEDNANYPDCTEAFRMNFERAANNSLGVEYTNQEIRINAPLMFRSKAETINMSYYLPGCWEALAYSHTSYDGVYPPTDNNHASVLRAQGFEEADFPDPLVIRAYVEGLMELPTTPNYRNEKASPAIERFCQNEDNRINRENFNFRGTVTGRFSAGEPNLAAPVGANQFVADALDAISADKGVPVDMLTGKNSGGNDNAA